MNGKSKFYKVVAENRKARFDYHIEEVIEAGIMLTGSEVKSLRAGKASITESHADVSGNEIVLYNSYIPEYLQANRFNHSPRRVRKLLLHKSEIRKLLGKVKIKGYTLVILSIYFNDYNKAKASLALAKGKSQHDKRQTEKERDWNREKSRVLKNDN